MLEVGGRGDRGDVSRRLTATAACRGGSPQPAIWTLAIVEQRDLVRRVGAADHPDSPRAVELVLGDADDDAAAAVDELDVRAGRERA